MEKATALNAHKINAELEDAMRKLSSARAALTRAQALIENNENDPAMQAQNVVALKGALDTSLRFMAQENLTWASYASARD